MTAGRNLTELAILALFCVIAIFFFPAIQGPYSAVHGPVSALQAARSAIQERTAMFLSARKVSGQAVVSPLVALSGIDASIMELRPPNLAECGTILRC